MSGVCICKDTDMLLKFNSKSEVLSEDSQVQEGAQLRNISQRIRNYTSGLTCFCKSLLLLLAPIKVALCI